MKLEFDIVPQEHGLMPQKNVEEAFKAIHDLYGDIWCEACYDPTNEDYRKFARRLLPKIEKANEILGFKT